VCRLIEPHRISGSCSSLALGSACQPARWRPGVVRPTPAIKSQAGNEHEPSMQQDDVAPGRSCVGLFAVAPNPVSSSSVAPLRPSSVSLAELAQGEPKGIMTEPLEPQSAVKSSGGWIPIDTEGHPPAFKSSGGSLPSEAAEGLPLPYVARAPRVETFSPWRPMPTGVAQRPARQRPCLPRVRLRSSSPRRSPTRAARRALAPARGDPSGSGQTDDPPLGRDVAPLAGAAS
jgi:hypothetical protein